MDGYANVPKNCNGCRYKQEMGRHWELEDYCFLNQISINRIDMEKDCPLLAGKGEIMYRVPHCSECVRCKGINTAGYMEYYCCKDADANVYGETVGSLGVDYPPKTSPKWCPKRERK